MELERQENVLVIGHQVHEFFVLSGKSLSDLCFPGYFALFVSAARLRQNLRSMRCLLAKYAHASSFHLCLCFFWWGGVMQIRIFPPSATRGFALYQSPAAYSHKAYAKSVWM